MQGAGRSDIDLVLTGTDFLAAGIEQGLLVKILPEHAAKFPNLMANYQPAAAKMQELARDQGIEVAFMPAGPLLEYNPDKVKQVPTTPAELLAWCKANPEPAHLRASGQLRARAARSSWGCRTSSATRIRRIPATAGTRPGRT